MNTYLALAHAYEIAKNNGFVPNKEEIQELVESGDVPKVYAKMDLDFLEEYVGYSEYELVDEMIKLIMEDYGE